MKIDVKFAIENEKGAKKDFTFGITIPDSLCSNPSRIRDVFTDLNIEGAVEDALDEMCGNGEDNEQD